MAGIIINDNLLATIEIDMTVSHNKISLDLCKEILLKAGKNPPRLEKGQVKMNLADGKASEMVMGYTQLPIKLADISNRSAILPVFVLNGPNCLLGRPAIRHLWPGLYRKLTYAAQKSINALSHLAETNQLTVRHDSPVINAAKIDERHDSSSIDATIAQPYMTQGMS